MKTRWTDQVTPENVLPEHPQPLFRRDAWMSLNGLWNFKLEKTEFKAIQGFIEMASMTEGASPQEWDGELLVPFTVDAPLSGVMHILRPQERLWYQREFNLPEGMQGKRILLHIEASDWETSVYVNGKKVGQHRGAYDPFSFEITDALVSGSNKLSVCVWDATEQQAQPLGKQIMPENRMGFRYQPTGGIWQPVWIEAVSKSYLASAKLRSDVTGLTVTPDVVGSGTVKVRVLDGEQVVGEAVGEGEIRVDVPSPKLWSPETPNLYAVELLLEEDGKVVDRVSSHTGLRTISKNDAGEILLNGKPIVMYGPLDQGYWPDGILTPPSDEAIIYDLQYLKDIGCNMVRVHIKTHPARWYHHADRLGLLVIQDMICMPKYGQTVTAEASANWTREFAEMIADFGNHPSIISWCVFNEAWGQHETIQQTAWAKETDPSRLTLSASGWTDRGVGDILDVHQYATYPTMPIEDKSGRCITIGEAGGHNLIVDDHHWHGKKNARRSSPPMSVSGKRMTFAGIEDMDRKYDFYFRNLRHFVTRGGCRSIVYTQIADVEHECNGYMTYDREVSKLPKKRFADIHEWLFKPVEYSVVNGGRWQRMSLVTPKGKKPKLDWEKATGEWTTTELPMESAQGLGTDEERSMLALKQQFEISESPQRAVLEIRFKNGSFNREPKPERLDGHQPRPAVTTRVAITLDGKPFRDHLMSVHTGHGLSVSYLELTNEEVAALSTGAHEIGLMFPAANELYSLDVQLLSYR
ncbi:glycoside hydrolase family 2 protein [Rhodopirellula sallentina]|uniref:Glycosyl hydrolase, family 2 n=1 Tax=Rhodopirellula sallentina SM41 TaxID=1263870 RepID=M5U706_9BACT|nr:glycoside hydrolase family 2 [Rhodopirellula sallentina]EMI57074.1 glycosyl hydrolase, family 2 [Rhodopirellula sallentina SM41]